MGVYEYIKKFNLINHYSFPTGVRCIYCMVSPGILIDLVRVNGKDGLFLFIRDYVSNEPFLFEWQYTKDDYVFLMAEHNYRMDPNLDDLREDEEVYETYFVNDTINSNTNITKLEGSILDSFMSFMISNRRNYMAKRYNLI